MERILQIPTPEKRAAHRSAVDSLSIEENTDQCMTVRKLLEAGERNALKDGDVVYKHDMKYRTPKVID